MKRIVPTTSPTQKLPETLIGHRPGVDFLESLNSSTDALNWLKNEVTETCHVLAGKDDDQPVQAILSHYQFLSFEAKKLIQTGLHRLVLEWRTRPDGWNDSAVSHILNLVAEIPVIAAKDDLKQQILNGPMKTPVKYIPSVLRAIATHPTKADIEFWYEVTFAGNEYKRMRDQVLTQIQEVDKLVAQIEADFPGAKVLVDEPHRMGINHWLDITRLSVKVTVERRSGQGYGVYALDAGYGEGPTEIFRKPAGLLEHLKTMFK